MLSFLPPSFGIAACVCYAGINPSPQRPVRTATNPADRKLRRARMRFFKPENGFPVREGLIEAVPGDLIGGGAKLWERGAGERKATGYRAGRQTQREPGPKPSRMVHPQAGLLGPYRTDVTVRLAGPTPVEVTDADNAIRVRSVPSSPRAERRPGDGKYPQPRDRGQRIRKPRVTIEAIQTLVERSGSIKWMTSLGCSERTPERQQSPRF